MRILVYAIRAKCPRRETIDQAVDGRRM